MLNISELKARFTYDPSTGDLLYAVAPRYCRVVPGDVVGWVDGEGKRMMRWPGTRKVVSVHRVIWYWCKGEFPKFRLMFVDGDPANTRIENLMPVSPAARQQFGYG